jgi:hypothetical protein
MDNKISRRDLFKNAGAVGAATLLNVPMAKVETSSQQSNNQQSQLEKILSQSSKSLLEEHEAYLVELHAGEMIVSFDRRYGSISSIRRKGDEFATNFIGNELNTPGVDASDSRWTGDVVSTVWQLLGDLKPAKLGVNDIFQMSGKWRRELTSKSGDIRHVGIRDNTFTVNYDGQSSNDEGIRSYRLSMAFHPGEGNSLLWDFEIQNVTSNVLELGELGLPLMVNDDYAELYYEPSGSAAISTINNVDFARTPLRQKLIHEQKVLVHHFIAGHSSYALVQRPLGDAPFLLFHPVNQESSFECIYKDSHSSFASRVEGWAGPDVMAIHSRATKILRGWESNTWVNGHTSVVLQPGEKKSYQMRFAFVDSYEAIRDELYKAGNLGIRVLPSMVVQEDTEVLVELQSKSHIDKIVFFSDNIKVIDKKSSGDKTLLTLSFRKRGQKSLKLHYGNGRWTNLHFYCIEDIEQLLKARGKFIVEREFYDNPEDPYHRHHGFLPFDHRIGSSFLDSEEVWEVGGSDESGFSEPLFLAAKNVYFPSREEVDTLEMYVEDCLFKYIQNPTTYEVRASLYWKERFPSSPWGHWTKERSEATFRTYNYVHPANIYHALYRIGKRYGLLKRKKAEEYLRMSYRTCLAWFNAGPWKHIGMMEGSNAIGILEDIKREGWEQEYENLRKEMKVCDDLFVQDPYPYSSELIIDQTAHEQVYFFTRFFGDTEKNRKTVQVLKALRGGNQPIWFRYGNDKRRDVCCWYNASLNGMALLNSFEASGDQDALLKGYAGVMSVMRNVLPDGMGFNYFICTAGRFDSNPPTTFESGTGLWGFLQSAKSYVVKDPSFGLIGYGCRVRASGRQVTVFPKDGLRKRIRFAEEKIDVEVTQGEIRQCLFDTETGSLELQMEDSTGIVNNAAVSIRGLETCDYRIRHGNSSKTMASDGSLAIELPMPHARHFKIEKIKLS